MITAVTTTRNRRLCFNLLKKWVSYQTVKPDQWIVVNDGTEEYDYSDIKADVIKRTPDPTEERYESILKNWRIALPFIKGDKIIVLEDDDYYRSDFCATLSNALDTVDLAGVNLALYYKLPTRRFQRMGNIYHASLASTAFRSSVLPCLEYVLDTLCPANKSVFIDMYLWHVAPEQYGHSTQLIGNSEDNALTVQFKCMPGAHGLGMGHQEARSGSFDADWSWLNRWCGRDTARVYMSFFASHCRKV